MESTKRKENGASEFIIQYLGFADWVLVTYVAFNECEFRGLSCIAELFI